MTKYSPCRVTSRSPLLVSNTTEEFTFSIKGKHTEIYNEVLTCNLLKVYKFI